VSGFAADVPTLAEPRVVEVSDGVYAYVQDDGTWWINNTGFIVGTRAVTAIDACSTERRTRALRAATAQVAPHPVQTLVNTHHHGDHTHGNYLFADATIVAHERCREEVLAAGLPSPMHAAIWDAPEWGHLELAPPTVTFADAVTVWSDDLACEVRHVGTPAHTTNDCVVWLPARRVLFAGDLVFNGGTPFLLMGSLAGALEAVAALRAYDADVIVPGHGPVCGPEIIDTTLDYLRFVDDLARRAHAEQVPPLQAARDTDLGRFADLTDRERIVGNLHRAYAELDGGERGAPIDLAAALTDMVAYHGGRPLTCRA
jgi:cyclase